LPVLVFGLSERPATDGRRPIGILACGRDTVRGLVLFLPTWEGARGAASAASSPKPVK